MTNKLPSKTFCILPWIHLSTRPDGQLRVCCTANASSVGPTNDKKYGGQVGILKNADGKPANLNNSTLLDAWNNDYMKNVRLQMLNGEIPPSCLKCFKEEASGHRSKRNWETEYWMKRIDLDELLASTAEDGAIPAKLYYVDLRLGSKCNLRCTMCSPFDSSNWIPDWQKIFPHVQNPQLKEIMKWEDKGRVNGSSFNWHKNNPNFWSQLYDQIPHMKQLYFAGGEPLIIDEHYKLLEEVIQRGYAKDIELRYNSNGTVIPDKLFKLWDHFKKVRFHFSIDSIKDMNHYIRYPTDWNTIVKHLWLLDQTDDHIEITIACSTQALNIYYIPEFIQWKLDQGFKKINAYPFGAGLINQHFVYHPAHQNVRVLPQWFKDEVAQKYEDFYPWLEQNWMKSGAPSKEKFLEDAYGIKRLKGIIQFMMDEDWSNRMPEFREFIGHIDRVRNLDFRKTFPEMGKLLDE